MNRSANRREHSNRRSRERRLTLGKDRARHFEIDSLFGSSSFYVDVLLVWGLLLMRCFCLLDINIECCVVVFQRCVAPAALLNMPFLHNVFYRGFGGLGLSKFHVFSIIS